MHFSTIFTALFFPYIAHERTAQNLIFTLHSFFHWAPSLPKCRFTQEQRAIERFQDFKERCPQLCHYARWAATCLAFPKPQAELALMVDASAEHVGAAPRHWTGLSRGQQPHHQAHPLWPHQSVVWYPGTMEKKILNRVLKKVSNANFGQTKTTHSINTCSFDIC